MTPFQIESVLIEHLTIMDGKLILQGAGDDVEGIRDVLGWTVTDTEEQGPSVLTASGYHVVLTLILKRNSG